MTLVGYDQVGGYYVLKNSYGPTFAAGGFCKVSGGVTPWGQQGNVTPRVLRQTCAAKIHSMIAAAEEGG